ncbi:MAG: hypothetical protein PSN34_07660 [Urechidicola sp.]|nr:hypothetical protein [Urechidicola sp.]
MKKIYILFLFCSINIISFSQTTLIPDTNFEQKLVDLGIDTNGITGDILNTDAQSVTNLDVSNSSITDLTGIKIFTSLTTLNCSNNTLSSLNLIEINGLITLYCNNNNLTQLFFNSNLAQLLCHFNSLTHLDLRLNTSINYLDCRNNNLYSLNLANGNNASFGTMLATTNNLTYIETDDSVGANNGTGIYAGLMWAKDASAFYAGPLFNTYVPDDNFEQALIDLGYDSVLDDYVSSSTINSVSTLNVHNKNISDLTGIAGFNNLTSLTCTSNSLQTLDLSHNLALTSVSAGFNQIENLFVQNCSSLDYLSCTNNSLTYLNTSQNIVLDGLSCSGNQFDSLDVTQNTSLTTLTCNNNSLTSLDVTQNTILATLNCYNNPLLGNLDVSQNINLAVFQCTNNGLSSLDVTANINLTSLKIFTNNLEFINLKQNTLLTTMDASSNASLSCIQVANETDANSGTGIYAGWSKDVATSYAEFCSNLYTYVPDNNFEQALINLGYDTTLNDYVLTEDIELVTSLSVNGESITDLTGIEDFVALQNLNCGNNGLTTLDVTQNINLLDLRCYQNSLTSLDVTQNILLTDLRCGTNSINTLDVSQNSSLTSLRVQNNSIGILDLTSNNALETLFIYNNSITEIYVDNLTNLATFWCYENLLTRLDVTQNTSLTGLRCYDNDLSALNLVQNVLLIDLNATLNTNLTCIQVVDEATATSGAGIYTTWAIDSGAVFSADCNYLQETYVPDDNFEQALINLGYDVGALDNFVPTANIDGIFTLDIIGESISDLTGIEDFTNLQSLLCQSNTISTLDVSNNSSLHNLYCANNGMTSLALPNSINILHCFTNDLSMLDVSSLSSLTDLKAYSNNLSTLDLSSSLNLTILSLGINDFSSIDISSNLLLETLSINNNNLSEIDLRYHTALTSLSVTNNSLISELNLKNKPNLTIVNASTNPALTCVQVDDVAAAVAASPSWGIDAGANYNLDCGFDVALNTKVFLQGPLITSGTSIMDDGLRVSGYIPTTSPYSDALKCDTSLFVNTGNDAIVDWVYIELRDKTDNSTIIEGQSALLQADGDVVAKDGVSSLIFKANSDDYYIVVNHRNHLGAMSNIATSLSPSPLSIDFTSSSYSTYGNNAQVQLPSNDMALWAGDTNGGNQIKFSGAGNNANIIKDYVLSDPSNILNFITFSSLGNLLIDVNLNGSGKFSGAGNDSNIIKDNVLAHPGNILGFITYTIQSTVPVGN